jgi:hypothetical protein
LNSKDSKIFLIQRDKTIAQIAREVKQNSGLRASEVSLRVMISNLIHGHYYQSRLVREIKKLYPELKFRTPEKEKTNNGS